MVRLGMIGAGHFAARHVDALAQLEDRVRLAAFARRREAEPFPEAEAMGARLMPTDALLASDDIDAVVVVAPNHVHRLYAEAAMRAGKHVFCEKPLAMTVEDADALLDAAAETGRVLMVGHVTRYMPMYLKVAEVLDSGLLGAPKAAYVNRMHSNAGRSWRMDPAEGGGIVFDLLIHDFDLLGWYMGKPKRVVARGTRHALGAYEQMAAIFTYSGGRIAVAEGGLYLRPPCGVRASLRVICEHGHVEVDSSDRETPVRIYAENRAEERLSVGPQSQRIAGLLGEYTEFIDAIEGKVQGRLRLEDARLAVAHAALTVEAADSGFEIAFR
ncbi:MAG: Gfo/Idh/MocA family oxidoreductase [Candidatus Hydrogenedentes bacterium]|nr:Gfo/Idh/MocA family oxidoreductase [Candidatus Hydrogenedentota bacterium]